MTAEVAAAEEEEVATVAIMDGVVEGMEVTAEVADAPTPALISVSPDCHDHMGGWFTDDACSSLFKQLISIVHILQKREGAPGAPPAASTMRVAAVAEEVEVSAKEEAVVEATGETVAGGVGGKEGGTEAQCGRDTEREVVGYGVRRE